MKLGLIGKARSGKDQFAEYLMKCLEDRHKRRFTHVAFASELKRMCKVHFDLSYDQLWERGEDIREVPDDRFDKPEGGKWSPREIMQELGGFYRRIQKDYWLMHFDRYIKREKLEDVVVTDVRHINECEYIKNDKGVLIRITRSTTEKIHGMDHESETALDDMPDGYFDIEISNDGTLEDLYGAAEDTSDAIVTIERMIQKGEVYNGE